MTAPRIVTDADVEKALDWLRDNARDIGAAKAAAIRTERMVKHVKALAMKHSGKTSAAAQEREAYCSQSYLDAIEIEAAAAGHYEGMKALREAAAMKIEAWRSEQANYRAMKI